MRDGEDILEIHWLCLHTWIANLTFAAVKTLDTISRDKYDGRVIFAFTRTIATYRKHTKKSTNLLGARRTERIDIVSWRHAVSFHSETRVFLRHGSWSRRTVWTTTETCPGCRSDAITLNRTFWLFIVVLVFKNKKHDPSPLCLFKLIPLVGAKMNKGRCWRKYSGTGRSHLLDRIQGSVRRGKDMDEWAGEAVASVQRKKKQERARKKSYF